MLRESKFARYIAVKEPIACSARAFLGIEKGVTLESALLAELLKPDRDQSPSDALAQRFAGDGEMIQMT
jgi:hypothetical protein